MTRQNAAPLGRYTRARELIMTFRGRGPSACRVDHALAELYLDVFNENTN